MLVTAEGDTLFKFLLRKSFRNFSSSQSTRSMRSHSEIHVNFQRSSSMAVRRKLGYVVSATGKPSQEWRPCFESVPLFVREIVPLVNANDAGERAACVV